MKLLVAVSSCRDWKPHFGTCFGNAMMLTNSRGGEVGITEISVRNAASQSNIAQSRQNTIDYAIESGQDAVMMFDDDMVFPPDVILKLAKTNKPFVFPNVCQKLPEKISGVVLSGDDKRLDSSFRSGLEKVLWGTLACTLIHVACFNKIPRPHFEILWDDLGDGNGRYIGEDHYFMQKVKSQGVELWCDHDLTHEVGHMGDYKYQFLKDTNQHAVQPLIANKF